jgi:hypothetical protein
MLGTSSNSTNGTKEWFCWLHVSADSSKWQQITVELNRLAWLVEILRSIRMYRGTPHWPEIYVSYKQKFSLNQRGDLVKTQSESLCQWVSRLEGVLNKSCHNSIKDTQINLSTGDAE